MSGRTVECLAELRNVWPNCGMSGRTAESLAEPRNVWPNRGMSGRTAECLAEPRNVWPNCGMYGRTAESMAQQRKVWHNSGMSGRTAECLPDIYVVGFGGDRRSIPHESCGRLGPMKATIRNEYNLSERVTQYLVKHIHDNDLKPGDLVPSEVQVSGKLGISRGV